MTKQHASWAEIKARRMAHPDARAAYERTRRVYELGLKVRHLREERGLSQSELARRMGTTQSVIARLELGGVAPRLETLDRVSRALDVDLVVDFRPREREAAPA